MARNKSAPIGLKLSMLLGPFNMIAIGPPLPPPDFNVEVLRAELIRPSHARCTFISLRKGGSSPPTLRYALLQPWPTTLNMKGEGGTS